MADRPTLMALPENPPRPEGYAYSTHMAPGPLWWEWFKEEWVGTIVPTDPAVRRAVFANLPARFPEVAFDDWCLKHKLPRNNQSLWRWLREEAFKPDA